MPGFAFSSSSEALLFENAPKAGMAILEVWPGLLGSVVIAVVYRQHG